MKKKGLIISTIVMVVVLIASLTTATYAWFSSSASAQVNTVNLTVGAASDVAIGVNKIAIDNNNRSLQTSYSYGSLTAYSNGAWTGGNAGLGTTVNTGVNLNVTAGVGTGNKGGVIYTAQTEAQLESANYIEGTNSKAWKENSTKHYTAGADQLFTFSNGVYTAVTNESTYSSSTTYYLKGSAASDKYAMDEAYTRANTLLTGEGNSLAELENIDEAAINDKTNGADVLDLQMAIKPIKAGNYGTYCVITITPTSDYVGMTAALWADISINGTQKEVIDLFDQIQSEVHFDTQTPTNNNEVTPYVFYFDINEFSTTEMAANSNSVTGFSIRLFVSGYDEDCNVNATGSSATIDIQFYGTKNNAGSAQYDSNAVPAGAVKLNLTNAA